MLKLKYLYLSICTHIYLSNAAICLDRLPNLVLFQLSGEVVENSAAVRVLLQRCKT